MKKLVSTLHLDHKEWLKYRKQGIGGSDACKFQSIGASIPELAVHLS